METIILSLIVTFLGAVLYMHQRLEMKLWSHQKTINELVSERMRLLDERHDKLMRSLQELSDKLQ